MRVLQRHLPHACVLALSAALLSGGETGYPVVQGPPTADAGLSGPVWSIAGTADGGIVAGANHLAVFDGAKWERIDVPGAYAFRGLAVSGDRIYAGGTNAVGWLGRTEGGGWQYTSLLKEALSAGLRPPAVVWGVGMTPDGPVFVTAHQALRWDGDRFEAWSLPSDNRLIPLQSGGRMLIHQVGVGLLEMGKEGPRVVIPQAALPPGAVVWAVSPADSAPMLIGTETGAYRLGPGGFEALPGLAAALSGRQPTCAVFLGKELGIAVGTYQEGIVLAGADGRATRVVGRAAGLPDDRINALYRDPTGRLWAGLSLGLVRLDPDPRVSVFDARNGIADGPVERVLAAGTSRILVTGKSVCRLVEDTGHGQAAGWTPLPPVGTYLRDACEEDGSVFAAGFGGIWRLSPSGEGRVGLWTREFFSTHDIFGMIASEKLPHTLYFADDFSLKALQFTPNGWGPRDLRANLEDTPTSLIEDAAGDLWAGTMSAGVAHFQVVADGEGRAVGARLVERYRPGFELPAGSTQASLSLVGDRVAVFTGSGIFIRDPARGFVPVRGLEGFAGLAAAAGPDRRLAWWILQRTDLAAMNAPALFKASPAPAADEILMEPVRSDGLETLGPVASLSAMGGPDGPVLFAGGRDRLLRLEAPEAASRPPASPVRLSIVSARNSRSPQFEWEPPGLATGGEVLYQTWLDGAENGWSRPRRGAAGGYPGLAPGAYTFRVRAVDRWGRTGPAASLAFEIPSPWFETWPALAGGAAALAVAAAGVVRWRIGRLRRQNLRLNQLVEERTRELAAANSAKTEFLENISHEIRNPLNGIIGLVSMLREARLDARERDLSQSLGACAKALGRVFDEVLNFAKLEHGQVTVQERPFALGELVEEVAALYRVLARQRGAALTVRREGEAWDRFLGDDEKLKSILGNFVSNALKYAPGSPVEIVAQVADADAVGATVFLIVSDRGPGIPPEEQDVIFQKFARGSRAKSRREPGTGLGLATCKALAELMGGHIGLESEPGKATTFFLRLWVKRDPNPSPIGADPAPAAAPEGAQALVVEDQPYNQIVVRRIAERLGYLTHVASSAPEALALHAKFNPDVVFLDWELPGMKGGEIARAIRGRTAAGTTAGGEPDRPSPQSAAGASRQGPQQPIIIATTAHDSETIRQECAAAGMDGFARKPFDESTIARLLDEAGARRGRRGTAPLQTDIFSFVGYDDPQQAGEAARLYLEMLDQETTAMDEAARRGDWKAAAGAAHRLKAHAGLVDCHELREAAERMQSRAGGAEAGERKALLGEVSRQATLLRERLKAWMQAGAGV
jgi:signal transduction histidine kinase/CheY-like chemotaxis protein